MRLKNGINIIYDMAGESMHTSLRIEQLRANKIRPHCEERNTRKPKDQTTV